MTAVPRSRLRAVDLLALGAHGVRAHPLRAALSALGIAIGIGAMISVIGIATSSQALVREKLSSLGTNLLTVGAGEDFLGSSTSLPPEAIARVRNLPGVEKASWIAVVKGLNVYRNALIDPGATGYLQVAVAGDDLLATTGTVLADGTWFDATTRTLDTVVLGHAAAQHLGVREAGVLVWLGDRYVTVIAILERAVLTPELDLLALVPPERATALLRFDGSPSTIFQRTEEDRVADVRELLPATVSPEAPNEVQVSRPSDALEAKNTIDQAFTGLLIGVGSIALLVGGIGVANTMVITVLERRREIGLRRSLGATRRHIRHQFLVEAMVLAALGGIAGTAIGWGVTAIVATANGWSLSIPPVVLVGGIGVTIVVGAVAGALPAVRAARTSPTAALSG